MAGFALLVLVVALFLLAHHRISVRREERLRNHIHAAATFLAPRLVEGRRLRAAVEEARRVWGDRPVVTVLRRTRQALRGQIAEAVSQALEETGSVAELARAAASGRLSRRVRALRRLGQCGGRQARAVLESALEDPRPEVRRAAREALPALRDDRAVRAAALSYLRDDEQRRAWRAGFFTNVAAYAPAALRALVASGALGTADEKLALEALAEVGDRDSLGLALERLEAPSAELRATAARVVGKLEERAAVPRLVPLLSDGEWIVRAAAARALETSPCGALACWALGARLADPVWWVRSNAARTLSRQGELGMMALRDVLDGDDTFARQTALNALALLEAGSARRREEPGAAAAAGAA